MTLDECKSLSAGDVLYATSTLDKIMTLRVTSIKTWKRDTNRIEVRVKYGLYKHYVFENEDTGLNISQLRRNP
jgi:hypothetical protein